MSAVALMELVIKMPGMLLGLQGAAHLPDVAPGDLFGEVIIPPPPPAHPPTLLTAAAHHPPCRPLSPVPARPDHSACSSQMTH